MVTRENAEGLFQSGGDGLRGQMVLAPSGMVTTAHPLASAAGLTTLRNGGNAMDAALAASAVCNVVLPQMGIVKLSSLDTDGHWKVGSGRRETARIKPDLSPTCLNTPPSGEPETGRNLT